MPGRDIHGPKIDAGIGLPGNDIHGPKIDARIDIHGPNLTKLLQNSNQRNIFYMYFLLYLNMSFIFYIN